MSTETIAVTVNVNGEHAVVEVPEDETCQTFLITERMTAKQFIRATQYNYEQRQKKGL